jgi:hypothetical protein
MTRFWIACVALAGLFVIDHVVWNDRLADQVWTELRRQGDRLNSELERLVPRPTPR